MLRKTLIAATALLGLCLGGAVPAAEQGVIRLATTTSTDNSGLLAKLLPPFEARTGAKVHVIAVGTGKALRMGQEGDVDVVLVHARPAEDAFMEAGYGVNRRDVMYNDFVIVGPASDPAGIKGLGDATEALQRIAAKQALFVSRGDDSGTHKKERALWSDAGVQPGGEWYREAGQGMGKVLQMAGELDAYTLADRGTWLAYSGKLPLEVLTEGDARLFNPYGVMAVNPQRYPDTNYMGALELIAWITSPEGQAIIRDFAINGQPLFTPVAVTLAKQ
ncbi:MAG: substrate-binding domain-containing protein [Gammaproteobacteria bacterium]|nr:substrate-binding domain-containing protein [Gammaproteobacteria bacterium]